MDIDIALSLAIIKYRHSQKLTLAECLEKMGMQQENPRIKPRINDDTAFEDIPEIITAIGTTIKLDYDIVNTLLNDAMVVFDQDMSVLADSELMKQLFESIETFLDIEPTDDDYDLRNTLVKYFYQRMTKRADDEYKEHFVTYIVIRIYGLIPWGVSGSIHYDDYRYDDCQKPKRKPYEVKNKNGKISMYIDVLMDLRWHISCDNHISIMNLLLLVDSNELLEKYQSANIGEKYQFFEEESTMQIDQW